MDKVIIGWREWIEIPEWNVKLKAKIDTGAKSSSIDVKDLRREGEQLFFTVCLSRKRDKDIEVTSTIHRSTLVKSSNGISQERHFIKLRMIMGGVEKNIEVSLACRKNMLHRMLLGREALQNDFLIDSGLDHLT